MLGLPWLLATFLLAALFWTLGTPARPVAAGPSPRLADSLLTVPLTTPAPALWSNFYPGGWSNDLPLVSGVRVSQPDGLLVASAVLRTSTDGGATWTSWGNNNLSVTSIDTATADLDVGGLIFPNSETGNLIQFRIDSQTGPTQTTSHTSEGFVIAVDTAPPGPPFGLQSVPGSWTNVNNFSETWSNPDDLSGIAGAYFLIDREPTFPTDGIFVATTNRLDDLQVSGDGAHNIFIWLQDNASNVTHLARNVDVAAFRYDSSPPDVGVSPAGPLGNNDWYTGTIELSFSPQDQADLSGVSAWGWQLDGATSGHTLTATIDGDLIHTVVVTATDVAGNNAQPASHEFRLDSAAPQLTHAIAPAAGPNGWYTEPLLVTFTLDDDLSGPDVVIWQLDGVPDSRFASLPTAPITLQVSVETDGQHTLEAHGQDKAGNSSAATQLTLALDTLPPVTAATINPAPAPSGYYTAPVHIELAPADATSGVALTRWRVNGSLWQDVATGGPLPALDLDTDGSYALDYYSLDVAGNEETSRTLSLSLDVTSPAAPTAVTLDPAGWSTSSRFDLGWQNPVDTSGIAGAYIYIGDPPIQAGQSSLYPQANPWAVQGQLDNLPAPGEGEWPVWLWLVDGAGNHNPASAVLAGHMRHDATPPQLSLQVSGPTGRDGWITGPANVILSISDGGSGPDLLRYRLDGNPWQESAEPEISFLLVEAGKHILGYYGQDVAGHLAGPYQQILRVDSDPPGPPLSVVISPGTWANTNSFTVTWRNPLDASGVLTAYTSLSPPSGPQDGRAWLASDHMAVLQAPAEGSFDLHLWLEDAAGHIDLADAFTRTAALRYDSTPPTTTVNFSAQPNEAGWFRGSIFVTLAAEDRLSGVVTTTWQLDDADPASTPWLFVEGDGSHTLSVQSIDQAGNEETPSVYTLNIDTLAPAVGLYPLSTYSPRPEVHVRWQGEDNDPASLLQQPGYQPGSSGVASYEVQVQEGDGAVWQPWLTGVSDTSATFTGQRGQVYRFRVRASDAAGNRSGWNYARGDNRVLIDPIVDGRFLSQNWSDWETHDALQMQLIQDSDLISGTNVLATRLGSTHWQACASPGDLPTLHCGDDWSSIAQTITVPTLDDMIRPILSFWYRIQTYDVLTTSSPDWATLCPQLGDLPFPVDTFDVTGQISGSQQIDLLWRDGNTLPQFGEGGENPPIPLRDLGWQRQSIDMTGYAGQTVRLELASHNRLDKRFNTWTDVYDIRLSDEPRQVYFPLMTIGSHFEPQPLTYCYPLGQPLAAPMSLWQPLPADPAGGRR